MKALLALLLLTTSGMTFAKKQFCTRAEIRTASARAHAHSDNDKNMHCSVSCMLTLRCQSSSVLGLGYLKELQDLFTPGDADIKDITADIRGIQLVLHKRADNDRECFQQCDLIYRRYQNR